MCDIILGKRMKYPELSINEYFEFVILNAKIIVDIHPFPQNYITHFKPRESGTGQKKKKLLHHGLFSVHVYFMHSLCV